MMCDSVPSLSAFLVLFILAGFTEGSFCPGEDWTSHGDQCIKIVKTIATYAEASAICHADYLPSDLENPKILELTSKEDNDFITNLLYNVSQVPLAVWLGSSRASTSRKEFHWSSDDSAFNFTNWTPNSPTHEAGRDCLSMESGLANTAKAGEWRDVTCDAGYWVVCQKTAALSVPDMGLGLVALNRWKEQHLHSENQLQLASRLTSLEANFLALKSSHETLLLSRDSILANHTILRGDFDALVIRHDNLQGEHNSLQNSSDLLTASHNSLVSSHNSLSTKHNTLQTQHDSLQANYTKLNAQHNSLQVSHNSLNTKHNSLQSQHNSLQTNHDSLNTKHNSLQTSHNTLQTSHNALTTKHNSLQTSHNSLQTYYNSLNTKHNSLQTSHNTLQSSYNSLNTKHTALSTKVTTIESSQTSLGKTTIPIGFLYTQLPFGEIPKVLWPAFTWTEVSSSYAGRFFRVVGGDAASFGQGQSDSIQIHQHEGAVNSWYMDGQTNGKNGNAYARGLRTGPTNSMTGRTAGETRPVNFSVKIWKRTA